MEDQKPKTLMEAIRHYTDANNALAEVADSRWSEGVVCQHCGAPKPMFLKTRRIWKCSKCRKQFSVKTRTVFEDSPIPLDKWLAATWLVANCKNGVSSYEIARDLGVTQKTAWFMLHRIRLAMQDPNDGGKLGGEVEVDETFIGGRARNMHKDRKAKVQAEGGRNLGGKAVVLGALERGKKVKAAVVPDRKQVTMQDYVRKNVKPGSCVFSDEHAALWRMDDEYLHGIVNHLETYVQGNIHTNGMENFWSLLKRTIRGSYISVEPFHLFRYVDEQAFRFNNRRDSEGEDPGDFARFKMVLSQIVGKRLTYDGLIGKEAETASC